VVLLPWLGYFIIHKSEKVNTVEISFNEPNKRQNDVIEYKIRDNITKHKIHNNEWNKTLSKVNGVRSENKDMKTDISKEDEMRTEGKRDNKEVTDTLSRTNSDYIPNMVPPVYMSSDITDSRDPYMKTVDDNTNKVTNLNPNNMFTPIDFNVIEQHARDKITMIGDTNDKDSNQK